MAIADDLSGRRFGRLTVIVRSSLTGAPRVKWKCICDCGREADVASSHLKGGRISSCGCLRKEMYYTVTRTHGHATGRRRSPELTTYHNILERCYNVKNSHYRFYGGRGIGMCDRWRSSFENFLSDVGLRPSSGHSIDRISCDGDYSKENCRWATRYEQARNKSNNVMVSVFGETMCLRDAVRKFSVVHESSVRDRMANGWSVEASLTRPAFSERRGKKCLL